MKQKYTIKQQLLFLLLLLVNRLLQTIITWCIRVFLLPLSCSLRVTASHLHHHLKDSQIYQCFVIPLYSVYLSLMAHTVSTLILATNILKTLKLKSCIHLFIRASEYSRRLAHTVSIDFSIFFFLELFGVAPVMHLDLFLSEILSSVSETTSLSFSEFSSEPFLRFLFLAIKIIVTVNNNCCS